MNKKHIIYLVAAIVFIGIGVWALYLGVKQFKNKQENNEFVYTGNDVEFVLYHVLWCPYCRTTVPIWEEVTKKHKNRLTASGKTPHFRKMDCTDENTIIAEVNGKEIDAFPTIYFNNNKDKQLEFATKCTEATLDKFIEDCLSKN
tara:strand:+ start:1440 stop:1874 length:435 start_codon:yes stop_codon:yes gene_type:complete